MVAPAMAQDDIPGPRRGDVVKKTVTPRLPWIGQRYTIAVLIGTVLAFAAFYWLGGDQCG